MRCTSSGPSAKRSERAWAKSMASMTFSTAVKGARAVDLDRLLDDPLRRRRDRDLDLGDLRCGAPGAYSIDQPGSSQHEQSELVDPDPGLGDDPLHVTLLG